MTQTILVPIDGSENSMKAFQYAITLAEAFEGQIVLINVQPSYNSRNVRRFISQSEVEQYQQELAKEAFDKVQEIINTCKVPVSTKLRIGNPSIEICEEAVETNATNIVMGSRGLGALQRTVLGSVSYGVLHSATCPVTIIPSH